jgi:DNA gyrase/topoisomerase IV subunit B
VISVKVPSPEFEGQTKTRLGNPEVTTGPGASSTGASRWLQQASSPPNRYCISMTEQRASLLR